MTVQVTDTRSNSNDQLVHAAETIGASPGRRAVFDAVTKGKAKVKSVETIMSITSLSHKMVLTHGNRLASLGLIKQVKVNKRVAYEKDPFYSQHRTKVLALAADPKKRAALPTKTAPRGSGAATTVQVSMPSKAFDVEPLNVDTISALSKVRRIPTNAEDIKLSEADFKAGFQAVIGETGEFTDWGGEINDLWTTSLKVKTTTLAAAVAFKGPGKSGKLTPGKMGKNGDQIQRLFRSEASVFLLQYWSQIDESVVEQMHLLAIARSVLNGGKRVYYGIIDGTDSARLIRAYPDEFNWEEAK